MAHIREFGYKIGDLEEIYIVEEHLNIFLYYARDIDPNATEKLYYLIQKKIIYSIINNQQTDLTGFENMPAYFNANGIQQALLFIDNALIPL